jgi:hypothetical protein
MVFSKILKKSAIIFVRMSYLWAKNLPMDSKSNHYTMTLFPLPVARLLLTAINKTHLYLSALKAGFHCLSILLQLLGPLCALLLVPCYLDQWSMAVNNNSVDCVLVFEYTLQDMLIF